MHAEKDVPIILHNYELKTEKINFGGSVHNKSGYRDHHSYHFAKQEKLTYQVQVPLWCLEDQE